MSSGFVISLPERNPDKSKTQWRKCSLDSTDQKIMHTCSDLPFQTPLIIYLFHFVVDYAEITFMVGDLQVHFLDERMSITHFKTCPSSLQLADVLTAVALYAAVKEYNKQVVSRRL